MPGIISSGQADSSLKEQEQIPIANSENVLEHAPDKGQADTPTLEDEGQFQLVSRKKKKPSQPKAPPQAK